MYASQETRQNSKQGTVRDGVSREVPCSALKGETVPDSLPATPKSRARTRSPSPSCFWLL